MPEYLDDNGYNGTKPVICGNGAGRLFWKEKFGIGWVVVSGAKAMFTAVPQVRKFKIKYMQWIKFSEANPVHTGQYCVKTKEGRKNVFIFTGSDISLICMRDQYEFWLDEAELTNPKEPETVHGNEAEKGVFQEGYKRCDFCNTVWLSSSGRCPECFPL